MPLLDVPTVDLPYLTSVFPQFTEYVGECIGVQSKRGCPYDCAFCLYPYIGESACVTVRRKWSCRILRNTIIAGARADFGLPMPSLLPGRKRSLSAPRFLNGLSARN